jgi:hypothetical protein
MELGSEKHFRRSTYLKTCEQLLHLFFLVGRVRAYDKDIGKMILSPTKIVLAITPCGSI